MVRMTDGLRIFVMALAVWLMAAQAARAIDEGLATQYIVTVKKVELCTNATCTAPVILGTDTKNFDIASAAAGAAVGSYAKVTGLSTGTTFTHMRVTVSRTFTITGYVDDTGTGQGWCNTDGGAVNAGTAFGTGDEAANEAAAAAAASQSLYLLDVQGAPGPSTNDAGTLGAAWNYDTPTFATSLVPSGSDALIIYALTNAFTVGAQMPSITIKFNTSTALGIHKNGATDDDCNFYPAEPSVEISFQ